MYFRNVYSLYKSQDGTETVTAGYREKKENISSYKHT